MSGDPSMTTIGRRMIGGSTKGDSAHYGPKVRQRYRDWADNYGEDATDPGMQVRYIENTMSWKAVPHETLAKCMARYTGRFGTNAGKAMAGYFNPEGTPLNRLSQTVIDLWYFTVIGDLIQRGGYQAP
jgi:hypothetical protein